MSNDDNPRRNRPEDNPFIAFRRFADSQVSSLLNTVFTIPATIANYNNVHQAREACLFKKADKTQCDKLQELEADIADLRHEGRELYKAGELQQMLKKSDELMRLDERANELRREILGPSKEAGHDESDRDLIQRVATKKGQEWGWDWSWGFPKPFDNDSDSTQSTRDRHLNQYWDDVAQRTFAEIESSPMFRAVVGDKDWEELKDLFAGAMKEYQERGPWTRSWRFPPPTDARRRELAAEYSPRALEADQELQKTGVNWQEAYNDLMKTDEEQSSHNACPWRRQRVTPGYPKRVPWEGEETADEPSYGYSHDHEDQHDEPPSPRNKQSQFVSMKSNSMDNAHKWSAEEDQDLREFLSQSHEEKQRLLQTATERKVQVGHETHGKAAETELDAYDHLLSPETSKAGAARGVASYADNSSEAQPSILSTLTTTERTVAADGSVTTKVVLKKRFADGREESSETIHTQRGQDMQALKDRGIAAAATAFRKGATGADDEKEQKKNSNKTSGWFWSN